MSNPNGCPFVHSQPVPNIAIRCPYCDYVTPPAVPGTFITLNAARAEARPAPVVDREAVALLERTASWIEATIPRLTDLNLRAEAARDADALRALLSPATSPGEGSSQSQPCGAREPISLAATDAEPSAAGEVCGYRVGAEIEAYFPTITGARDYLEWAVACSPHLVTLDVAQRQGGEVVWVTVETHQGKDGI